METTGRVHPLLEFSVLEVKVDRYTTNTNMPTNGDEGVVDPIHEILEGGKEFLNLCSGQKTTTRV